MVNGLPVALGDNYSVAHDQTLSVSAVEGELVPVVARMLNIGLTDRSDGIDVTHLAELVKIGFFDKSHTIEGIVLTAHIAHQILRRRPV